MSSETIDAPPGPIATVGDWPIDLDTVIYCLKAGRGRAVLDGLIQSKVIAAAAEQRGIVIDVESLDNAFAEWRAARGLFETADLAQYFSALRIDEVEVRADLRQQLIAAALRTSLVSDDSVRQRYSASPYDYAEALTESILLPTAGSAAEVILQLRESEITWEAAAEIAGDMRSARFYRRDASAESAALLFAAPIGGFVGPLDDSEEGYAIYRIAWRADPGLNDQTQESIRDELYTELLSAMVAKHAVRFCL